MNPLEAFLTRQIALHGPMDVGQFMQIALTHPQHGYYMSRDPLGRGGDFTTAPEISQIFGEMIGIWAADVWQKIGSPHEFILAECGPGRGTLMADMLRATKNVSGFHAAAKINLIEVSPVLRGSQKSILGAYDVRWCEDISALPEDIPMIVIGNEFLDALPFRQLQKFEGKWYERCIDFDREFCFVLRPCAEILMQHIPLHLQSAPEGSIYEFSPARESFLEEVCRKIKIQNGAALLIDYGHKVHGVGDTFQALKNNQYINVFSDIGKSDLTSHVDFEALAKVVHRHNLRVDGAIEQGTFLSALGITTRAEILQKTASPKQRSDIKAALQRLTDPSEMGSLFKVICMSRQNDQTIKPAGF